MNAAMKTACGASAFTCGTGSSFSPADETGMYSRPEDASGTAWDRLIDELLRLRCLEDDWDGAGSAAPHPGLVDGAVKLALALKADGNPPADRVIASVNGTIYFEWHTPLGYHEIEVLSALDVESRWLPKGAKAAEVVGITFRP